MALNTEAKFTENGHEGARAIRGTWPHDGGRRAPVDERG